ncbi:MAG: hypothetical protein IAE66_05945 [Xanthomonadaceae bacterium]|nr:hypothetical protein [Xanthomonadaceae bacterium]
MLATTWGAPALAQQIRRCTGSDGRTVTTDKPCAAIGAVDRIPRPASAGGYLRRPTRAVCARNVDELSYEITSAIDLNDANRLAGVYHWAGMGGEQAYQVMSRLETVVKKPLADIGPVGGGVDAEPAWREDAEGNLVPVYAKPRAPTGLKIEQLAARGDARTTRTVFGLRRYMGCLWISF